MYTVSIVADQQLKTEKFAEFMAALDYVKVSTGHELCALTAWGEVISGRGVIMCVRGVFITLARYH